MADYIFIENEDLGVIRGTPSNEGKHPSSLILLTEPDGTLRAHSPVILADQYGREVPALAEDNGTQSISLYGTDPTNALAALRTDAARISRQRGFEPWRFADTVEPAPGGGYGTVYTVPAASLAVIEWRVVSTLGTPEIDVHAVENAGAPDTSNAEVIGASPMVGCLPLRAGPIQLEAGGTIQCRNTAAAGNTGNVRVWVELYSLGDAVA